jgi:hypothetical protein
MTHTVLPINQGLPKFHARHGMNCSRQAKRQTRFAIAFYFDPTMLLMFNYELQPTKTKLQQHQSRKTVPENRIISMKAQKSHCITINKSSYIDIRICSRQGPHDG